MYIKPEPAIYRLDNETTGEYYVGGTRHAQARKRQHYYDFRKGKHRNPRMQTDYNLGHPFSFSILEYLPIGSSDDVIVRREQEWYEFLKPAYNTKNAVAIFGSDIELQKERKMAGHSSRKQSPEEIAKRVQSVKEYWATHPPKKMPLEFVERLKARMTGDKHHNWGKETPQEVRDQISSTLVKEISFFKNPDGEIVEIGSLKRYIKETKLWGLYNLKWGKVKSYRGWTFVRSEAIK